jgi:hypothetical protein
MHIPPWYIPQNSVLISITTQCLVQSLGNGSFHFQPLQTGSVVELSCYSNSLGSNSYEILILCFIVTVLTFVNHYTYV